MTIRDSRTPNAGETSEKREIYTVIVPMTASELREASVKLGHDNLKQTAAVLGVKYRTFQDWIGSKSSVPDLCAVAVRLMLEKDKWATDKAVGTAVSGYDERKRQVMDRFLRRHNG
jgi:hypothetical protein